MLQVAAQDCFGGRKRFTHPLSLARFSCNCPGIHFSDLPIKILLLWLWGIAPCFASLCLLNAPNACSRFMVPLFRNSYVSAHSITTSVFSRFKWRRQRTGNIPWKITLNLITMTNSGWVMFNFASGVWLLISTVVFIGVTLETEASDVSDVSGVSRMNEFTWLSVWWRSQLSSHISSSFVC